MIQKDVTEILPGPAFSRWLYTTQDKNTKHFGKNAARATKNSLQKLPDAFHARAYALRSSKIALIMFWRLLDASLRHV